MVTRQVLVSFITKSLWFFLVSSLSDAGEADITCLTTLKTQLKDPNGYLSDWVFGNRTAGYICKFTGVSCWHDDENRVLSIKLPGYGLEGEFPRGIKECSSLTALDLSRNNLSGTLPSDISTLIGNVTFLNLSFNGFSGEIPVGLAKISFLNTLMLNDNGFTGQIPPRLGLLGRLKLFSVANNLLTGPVPSFNSTTINPSSYENNSGLCGKPLDDCPASSSFSEMIITGFAVGASVFTPIGAGVGYFCIGKKDKQRPRIPRSKTEPI